MDEEDPTQTSDTKAPTTVMATLMSYWPFNKVRLVSRLMAAS